MNYPKQIMKIGELQKMGFSRQWLMMVFRMCGQKAAWKSSPAPNGHIMFDTDQLEKIRKAQCVGGRG